MLENFPIPEKYFSCPVEELFDLLGRTFAEFAGRMKRCRLKLCLTDFDNSPSRCNFWQQIIFLLWRSSDFKRSSL